MKLNTVKTLVTSLAVSGMCMLLFSGISAGRDNSQSKPTLPKHFNDTIFSAKEAAKKKASIRTEKLIQAMIQVESRDNDSAFCARENAAGCLQIRPIMVKEVNRILKRTGSNAMYTLADRWSRKKSLEMFYVWRNYHHKTSSAEKTARNWNGGPNGYRIAATQHYWNKVKNETK